MSQQPRSLTIRREPPPPGVDEDVDDEDEEEDPYFCETAIFSPGKPADDDNDEDDEDGDMFYKDEEESVWPDLEDLDGRNDMVSGDDESADDGSDAGLESANDAADEDLMFILEYAQKRRDKRSKKARIGSVHSRTTIQSQKNKAVNIIFLMTKGGPEITGQSTPNHLQDQDQQAEPRTVKQR